MGLVIALKDSDAIQPAETAKKATKGSEQAQKSFPSAIGILRGMPWTDQLRRVLRPCRVVCRGSLFNVGVLFMKVILR